MLKITTSLFLILSLSCASLGANVDKFAVAATAICDGMQMYEKYKPQLEMIKSLIEQKDYMTALFYSKGLYTEVQTNGDMEQVPELVSLISVLSNLASKVPLKIQKPEPGLRTL